MAREPSVTDENDAAPSADESAENSSNNVLLHRRSYLKMAGAATAAAASTVAAGSVAAADDYEVITVPRGQREVIRLGSGETYENVIFDQTAPGSAASIIAMGTDWTIRNVAWKGTFSHHDRALGVADTGNGTSRIENVYMGDGVDVSVGNRRHPKFGLWVSPDHNGHLEIDRMYVEGAHDNAFYGSAPGSNGNGKRGTIHYKNSFAKDCWVSGFRIARGKVENCTAINTSAGRNGRPIWVWNTDQHGDTVEIIDCDFVGGGYPYAMNFGRGGKRTDIYMEGTQYSGNVERRGNVNVNDGGGNGNNPDPSVPDGVPTSPEAVFDGNVSSGDEKDEEVLPDLPNVIVVDGRNTSSSTSYEFSVSETVQASTDDGATIDPQASVDGRNASGVVANWLDAYRFDGELETLSVDGNATIRVNGSEIDPADVGDADDAEDEKDPLENVILIEGASSDVTRYEFVASGDVEKANYEGASIDGEEVIDGNLVHGVVANWKDAFRFDGDLEELTVDGPGTVSVNDEEVDPDSVGQQLPHVLEIEGQGTPSSFNVTVDGTIEYDGDDADDVTIISGTTVESSITDSTQVFRFSGALTDVTFTDGEAVVTLDGAEVDLSEYGDQDLLPHAIVIDGTKADEPSTYSFTVDGKVVKSEHMDASIDEGDIVEGEAVRGGVGNWLDAYWFDGDIADFKLVGDAKTHVEYNARDQ